MQSNATVCHVFILGCKGLPARYGGYETFVDNLVTLRQSDGIRYFVACMSDRDAVEPYGAATCFHIRVPQIGSAKAVLYDILAFRCFLRYIRKNRLKGCLLYVLACRLDPFFPAPKQAAARETGMSRDGRVRFVGTVYDAPLLAQIRRGAFAYLHGHEVGGTNPSLLEALAATELNLLLDVSFNREVGGDGALYFPKDAQKLARLLDEADRLPPAERERLHQNAVRRIREQYSWEKIVGDYERLFIDGQIG